MSVVSRIRNSWRFVFWALACLVFVAWYLLAEQGRQFWMLYAGLLSLVFLRFLTEPQKPEFDRATTEMFVVVMAFGTVHLLSLKGQEKVEFPVIFCALGIAVYLFGGGLGYCLRYVALSVLRFSRGVLNAIVRTAQLRG